MRRRRDPLTLGKAAAVIAIVVSGLPALPAAAAAKPTTKEQRVVILALTRPEKPLAQFVASVSDPSSPGYGHYLGLGDLRKKFGATASVRQRTMKFLRKADGISSVQMGSTGSVVLATAGVGAAQRLFCARGKKPPLKNLCIPEPLRKSVKQIVVGGTYARHSSSAARPASTAAASGTPNGCEAALKTGTLTPNQISSAYESDQLAARGLDGQGIRVATLSSALVEAKELDTWASCFDISKPNFHQTTMPGAGLEESDAPEETYLDAEALLSVAPRLQRITAVFVPLVESFQTAVPLFMLGALDPARQGGHLPDVISISDAVCESRVSKADRAIGQRLLREAAALGVTTLAASGDLGFQGCQEQAVGAGWPGSSPYATSVGGTEITLDTQNRLTNQVVWSTFGTEPGGNGTGSGGGPSIVWPRPAWQQAPGVGTFGPPPAPGRRLTPDIASMGSFTPGLATLGGGEGWGPGGGTSAATPLAAGIIALVTQQERTAGRSGLGSINPLLYRLASGAPYGSVFSDVVSGTSSPKPATARGQTPIGGAAQPGYDLATGLGSLRAPAFAAAVAAGRGG